jgi:hypothetical protein
MAEWLPQITADTSYQEMLERPSAFNPRPDLVDSDLEITRIGEFVSAKTENMRHHIRYSDGTTFDVAWPVRQPVSQDEATTTLLDDSETSQNAWRSLSAANFGRFDHFWEPQAAGLSGRRLFDDGRVVFDKLFDFAVRADVFKDPRAFMHYSTRSFEHSLRHNMPGTAYAIARTTFNGVVTSRGETRRCHGLRQWLEEHVTHVIEPGVSQAIMNAHMDEYNPNDALNLNRMRRDMAAHAIDLAQCTWVMRSLQAADAYYAEARPALTEKLVWHQIATGRQAIIAAQNLTASMDAIPESLRGTTSLRPEGRTPAQIGSYVLGILN